MEEKSNKNIYCLFIKHFAIVVLYLSLTGLEFVITHDPNPIGVAIQQLLFMFIHVYFILYYNLVALWKETPIILRIKNTIISLLAIAVVVGIYMLLNNEIWGWLWQLRGQ